MCSAVGLHSNVESNQLMAYDDLVCFHSRLLFGNCLVASGKGDCTVYTCNAQKHENGETELVDVITRWKCEAALVMCLVQDLTDVGFVHLEPLLSMCVAVACHNNCFLNNAQQMNSAAQRL